LGMIMILLFKMAHKHRAEVLSSVPKYKMVMMPVMMYLTEKI
jgi:hypothetical protein